MFSIIICSIHPELVEALLKNIQDTIGCDYETLVFDNRQDPKTLAQVYNQGIRAAAHPLLMFVHEDVEFVSTGWGPILAEKMLEPTCGVIGLAGSKVMANTYSGWSQGNKYDVWHYRDHGKPTQMNISQDFSPVVCVDGFIMCVRKDIATAHPFDEEYLTDFHCYDVDFSLALHGTYCNYVCSVIDVSHNSSGTYSRKWYECTIKLYDNKWRFKLPATAIGRMPTAADAEEPGSMFLYRALRIDTLPIKQKIWQYRYFCKQLHGHKHISHCLQHGLKLVRCIVQSAFTPLANK